MKITDRDHPKATRAAALVLRLALAAGFLSAVADRLGLWGKPGAPGVAWGDWSNFISYTAKLNWFLPHQLIQPIGMLATLLETILAVGLLAGFWLRHFALASCGLLLLFALSMTVAIGIKPPLDYSVYTAAAGAALLATVLRYHKTSAPESPLSLPPRDRSSRLCTHTLRTLAPEMPKDRNSRSNTNFLSLM